jgi:hypothetical protein
MVAAGDSRVSAFTVTPVMVADQVAPEMVSVLVPVSVAAIVTDVIPAAG